MGWGKQICSCLVDRGCEKRVLEAMGEKQWMVLQLGRVK